MPTSSRENLPSLEEPDRVVRFVLGDELGALAGRLADGEATSETVRGTLAITIAVVTSTEHLFAAVGRPHPAQWESIERSAATFVDQYVVKVSVRSSASGTGGLRARPALDGGRLSVNAQTTT